MSKFKSNSFLQKTLLATACIAVLISWPLELATAQSPSIQQVDGGRGDVPLYSPSDYDGSESLPLVVSLHGYGSNSTGHENYFQLSSQIEEKQFLLAVPDGLPDIADRQAWNAYGCCGGSSSFDDTNYLRGLVDTIREQYAVDDNRIHFIGHSNGGFMSHRMAVDHSDLVASIVSFAGTNRQPRRVEAPDNPVHVLQIHGTADSVIPYDGRDHPGAEEVTLQWAEFNGLQTVAEEFGEPFPLDANTGSFGIGLTTRQIYDLNNDSGIAVELWTMDNSRHSPSFGRGPNNLFAPLTVDWLLAHPKVATVPEPSMTLLLPWLILLAIFHQRHRRYAFRPFE